MTSAVNGARCLNALGMSDQFLQIFECLPRDWIFYIKSATGGLIAANTGFLRRHSGQDLQGVEFDDLSLRRGSAGDHVMGCGDHEVVRSGVATLQRIEAVPGEGGATDWLRVSRFPVPGPKGEIAGILAIGSPLSGRERGRLRQSTLRQMVEYVHQHCHEHIAVEALARAAGISQRQLGRVFHKAFGVSVQEYIMRSRLKRACDFLVNTRMTLCEIALESGFSSQSDFGKAFKRGTGMTPKSFRVHHTPTRI